MSNLRSTGTGLPYNEHRYLGSDSLQTLWLLLVGSFSSCSSPLRSILTLSECHRAMSIPLSPWKALQMLSRFPHASCPFDATSSSYTTEESSSLSPSLVLGPPLGCVVGGRLLPAVAPDSTRALLIIVGSWRLRALINQLEI